LVTQAHPALTSPELAMAEVHDRLAGRGEEMLGNLAAITRLDRGKQKTATCFQAAVLNLLPKD